MFSGIVISQGSVKGILAAEKNGRLSLVAPDFMAQIRGMGREISLGESILVSGVCLTVVEFSEAEIEFDLASETLRKTKFRELKVGDRLNLEPSLRLSDILSGHLVAGHVDGVGALAEKYSEGDTVVLSISFPPELSSYLVPKGSISIDGVSLTVGEVTADTFKVYIVPHTAKVTTLGELKKGDLVNLEIDLIARYVERQLAGKVLLPAAA